MYFCCYLCVNLHPFFLTACNQHRTWGKSPQWWQGQQWGIQDFRNCQVILRSTGGMDMGKLKRTVDKHQNNSFLTQYALFVVSHTESMNISTKGWDLCVSMNARKIILLCVKKKKNLFLSIEGHKNSNTVRVIPNPKTIQQQREGNTAAFTTRSNERTGDYLRPGASWRTNIRIQTV